MTTGSSSFHERLSPPPVVHLLSVVAGGSAALACSVWGPAAAATGGIVAAVVVSVLLVVTAPVVEVTHRGDPADGGAPDAPRLRAGGAVIPVDALAGAEVLDADGLRRLLGVDADARAYVCHRSWVRTAVRLEVADPRDGTPYWLICTRRPAQLIAATGRR
ncbi:hypothetical protein GCM10023169_39990 [Georgenia halophila]|uniref:DUF3093 family protein n=1 Tax=Georgenia halophila TaxID=620889 RepID=A0ABP8LRU3_9MICO